MSEPDVKKSKQEDALGDLSTFRLKRVLNENSDRDDVKSVFLEGNFEGRDGAAVLILEKPPFSVEALPSMLTPDSTMKRMFTNDVYSKYDLTPSHASTNLIKAQVIHPATERHIAKYESRPSHLVHETPGMYRIVTEPYLEREQFDIEWVYNILSHKKEAETIVFENSDPEDGFILLPDYKWNGKQVEDLYLIAIVHRRGLRSLRELNGSHLPLLRNLWEQGTRAIKEKFGLPESQVRAYFHYQPTYYHLHVHFTHLNYAAPGISTEKSHLLPTVIRNISRRSDFYTRATLPFVVREGDKLYEAYKKAGYKFDRAPVLATSDGELSGLTEFFEALGRAKHEPCGEHWDVAFGETAWRTAVAAICLSPDLDRRGLISVALSSAFTSIGKRTDQCSEWSEKLAEVREFLLRTLPFEKAAHMYGLFLTHVNCRRKRASSLNTAEELVYSKLLEFEETLLMQEELRKEGEPLKPEILLAKMCDVGFRGAEKFKLLGDDSELKAVLAFLLHVSNLLSLKRTGWVYNKVRDPERVAGHMFRMALMAAALEELDAAAGEINRSILGGSAVIVSLLHDVPECIVGDITPREKVPAEEKHRREMEAMRKLVEQLPGSLALELHEAFARYEEQREGDEAAAIAKDLDKYDMILQAFEYERADRKRGRFLQEFFDSTADWFRTEKVRELVKHLKEKREAMHAGGGGGENQSNGNGQ